MSPCVCPAQLRRTRQQDKAPVPVRPFANPERKNVRLQGDRFPVAARRGLINQRKAPLQTVLRTSTEPALGCIKILRPLGCPCLP